MVDLDPVDVCDAADEKKSVLFTGLYHCCIRAAKKDIYQPNHVYQRCSKLVLFRLVALARQMTHCSCFHDVQSNLEFFV